MPEAAIPNLFIVGAPKSGTTALYSYLAGHPQVFMSRLKEPQFFAEDVNGQQRNIRCLADYLHLFSSSGDVPVIGEASTAYLGSPQAPRLICRFNPLAKVIVMLRHPVDVMYSLHSERLFTGTEHIADFGEAISSSTARSWKSGPFRGQPVSRLDYRQVTQFSCQLERYLEVFGENRVLVVLYDDFKADTAGSYRKILTFLSLPFHVPPHGFTVVNANRRLRSNAVKIWLRHPPAFVRNLLPRPLRQSLVRGVWRMNVVRAPRPVMDGHLRRCLVEEYREEILGIGRLIHRDLASWLAVA